jgi:gamma-glutamyl:cysteine ligase YbdK (ATP-grasp superfamily)
VTDLALGIEEELIVVDPETRALSHTGTRVLERIEVADADGAAHPDTYSALIELSSPTSTPASGRCPISARACARPAAC